MKIQSVSTGNVQANAAALTPRKVSGQKTTTPPKQVAEKHAERNAQAPRVAAESPALDPRLAAYARNVDSRLKVAIENASNEPREKAALEAAQKQFHSMVFRFDEAFLTEGKPKIDMAPGAGMNKIFEHLSNAVKTVLTHGNVDLKG
ncbi:MAG: hypothetical protein SGI72_15865 [Planctomycetota bacterium]|nr:hypothetical protein [Planctomycetota bacterium]